ncbi:unnamed protein product [Notodromas monacha]|uniref:Transmembrane protein n=1 Tax=Notodromas monacha TaxID=399045 RepID=A0A7R9BJG5_9CRUS|nr:unnamed protein product [Notodromas monacha]CAG0916628.1 unnamed protein product [Notodromas monacha]
MQQPASTHHQWNPYHLLKSPHGIDTVLVAVCSVERIDTVEGGGLSVLGLSLNNHCGVALLVFSAFFLLIGLILTVIAFSNSVRSDFNDDPNRLGFLQRNRLTLRVVGPCMIVSGFIMAACGMCFCALNWKVKQEEKEKEDLEYHCPLHDHGESRLTSHHRSRNSVSSALPMGIATAQYSSASRPGTRDSSRPVTRDSSRPVTRDSLMSAGGMSLFDRSVRATGPIGGLFGVVDRGAGGGSSGGIIQEEDRNTPSDEFEYDVDEDGRRASSALPVFLPIFDALRRWCGVMDTAGVKLLSQICSFGALTPGLTSTAVLLLPTNSLQSSGGCDLCYERAKTAKSIEEYEETEKYLNTMGRETIKGADIACFPRPLTPNNTIGDFGLPGAANGSIDQPGSIPDNNNGEQGPPSVNKPSSP